MTGAEFVHCPDCKRLLLGQPKAGGVYTQPHDCKKEETDE